MDARTEPGARAEDGSVVLESIVDLTAVRILSALSARPLTVRDLSMELRLPLASLYRKVHDLQAAGALLSRRVRDAETGKTTHLYESAIASVKVEFRAPGPSVQVAYRSAPDS